MRLALCLIGWLFIVAGVVVFGRELWAYLDTGVYAVTPLGRLWYEIDPSTLNMLQAGVERNISPAVWDYIVFPFLRWPAALVLAIPGLVLAFFCRRRQRMFR